MQKLFETKNQHRTGKPHKSTTKDRLWIFYKVNFDFSHE